MVLRKTPHDFWLHLRTHCPALARRLDGLRGLELAGSRLILRVPEAGWSQEELSSRKRPLDCEVSRFFGPRMEAVLSPSPADPEALPLPVLSSKHWNHVAFCAWGRRGALVLAVGKPRYLDHWLPRTSQTPAPEIMGDLREDPGVAWLEYSLPDPVPPGEDAATWTLPQILEDLAALARRERSYAHLVCAFPGDFAADRWEGRLYATKEWGTPSVPGPILRKYVGGLHYAAPGNPLFGLRLAYRALDGEA